MNQKITDFTALTGSGKELNLADLKGKTVLIVNTATNCGFAPQFKGLEKLYKTYKDKGFVVLGFPSDQFAHQEPRDDDEIKTHCELNFGVSFPLMRKIDVNGPATHPLWTYLKDRAPGFFSKKIKWNFTKFLVLPDGATVRRYAPTTEPSALAADIENALKA